MKKAIFITALAILLVLFGAGAAVFSLFYSNDNDIIFTVEAPPLETQKEIKALVSENAAELFINSHPDFSESKLSRIPDKFDEEKGFIRYERCLKLRENYILPFNIDGNSTYSMPSFYELGSYIVSFNFDWAFVVYLPDQHKLITFLEAYNQGIITDDDLDSFRKYSEQCQESGENSHCPFGVCEKEGYEYLLELGSK